MIHCPRCSSQTTDAAKYCYRCGVSIRSFGSKDYQIHCIHCGQKNNAAFYCIRCGRKLQRPPIATMLFFAVFDPRVAIIIFMTMLLSFFAPQDFQILNLQWQWWYWILFGLTASTIIILSLLDEELIFASPPRPAPKLSNPGKQIHCKHCGKTIFTSFTFCLHCGRKLHKTKSVLQQV